MVVCTLLDAGANPNKAGLYGMTPLMLSTGAGSGARNAIGTGVFGGVVAATVLAIFFIPLFYALVRRISGVPMTGKKDGSTPLEDREAQP